MSATGPAAQAVRDIIEANRYLVLATADATGRPWSSPVYLMVRISPWELLRLAASLLSGDRFADGGDDLRGPAGLLSRLSRITPSRLELWASVESRR
jgi:hypothetical protein